MKSRGANQFTARNGILLALGLILTASPAVAQSDWPTEVVVEYDEWEEELPEGIAVDKRGNIFVSLSALGSIDRITPDGDLQEFAVLDADVSTIFGALGLTVDAEGNVYAALMSRNEETHGVWVVTQDGQHQERLPGTEAIDFPNSLAFDKFGNLYITDSFGGAIWRIPPGGTAEIWVQDELLGSANPYCSIGANGIAYRKRSLTVANTCSSLIVRVPISRDGSAGLPKVVFDGTAPNPSFPFWPDGLALDVHGRIYTVNYLMNQLVRLSADGSTVEVLADLLDGYPIDEPASLAFGQGIENYKTVFITNFARFGIPPNPPDSIGPSVIAIELDTKGMPVR